MKVTIKDMDTLAESRGGKCVSIYYINSQTKLFWKCSEGHVWDARPAKVQFGSWCPVCSGSKRKTIENMKLLAEENSGQCLSTIYKNNHSKLDWKCKEGHYFSASYTVVMNFIKHGGFCTKCSVIRRAHDKKCTIEEMQEIAKERGGECLSTQYIHAHSQLTWKCANNHVFQMNANAIKNGHWCKHCRFYLNEGKCRFIIEKLTGKPFMSNKTVLAGLELDGYNEELSLAFEYNGIQHYEYIEFFHRNYEEFVKRQQYDHRKKELCLEKGIGLITISYELKNDKELVSYIYQKLVELGVEPLVAIEQFTFKGLFKKVPRIKQLAELARDRKGKLLSDTYHNNKTKLLWECEFGHTWEMRANDVISGQWCSVCNGSHKLTIEEMDRIAAERNGQCLSIYYKNNREKLWWRCEQGHKWDASADGVKGGNWCTICRKKASGIKRRLTIEEMHRIASERGGECLSLEYENNSIALTWKCSKGHTWEANANNIKSGTWCPRCKHLKRNNKHKLTS